MIVISKQIECQRFIFKIHSSRLREHKWNLTLPISEARKNEEVISLASSQVLRWLDELNGITDAEERAREIKREIKAVRKSGESNTKRRLKQLYAQLDTVQFKPDYMCLIIDKEKDYYRACKGFSINGISYSRLLGTNGGVKNSTIVFVSDRHIQEIRRRIDNGRNLNKALVPAKLESYKALACSASVPVSIPHGILVVSDATTKFTADTIYLDNEGDCAEPRETVRPNTEIEMDASDGFGLILPQLAERWSNELKLGYVASGFNTRFSFEKGMVFTFDFVEFADTVAQSSIVKDVWGNEHDIHNIEMIMTESMLKLWDSYDSIEDYIENCEENGYTFGVPKVCPEQLENERRLNYQFIQSYKLNDDDIAKLTEPTRQEINEILGEDWRKMVLYTRGVGLTEDDAVHMENNYIKALMIDERMKDDPFIKQSIYQLIKNRINEAKVGVLKVHGNYSIVCGDPYALCQHIFGMEVTGLLNAGEIYNEYWDKDGAEKLACFRAPMTTHNNIRLVSVSRTDDVRYWYRYIHTGTILNGFDTITAALNGCDFDGDLVMLTDNEVLIDKHIETPALMCVQRRAEKKVPTEEDLITANVNSFGNDIGKTTNWITSMFEVQSHFPEDSEEYKVLEYRIRCGQLFQQDAIDRTKGIICKPMPAYWHDRHAANMLEDKNKKDFNRSIVADKKPYFMQYIYPTLARQYKTYIKNTERNALREFGMTVDELLQTPFKNLTERQREFLTYYHRRMPVGVGDCVMNKICRGFEDEFDNVIQRNKTAKEFDYKIMKSGAEYSRELYISIMKLYEEYNVKLKEYAILSGYERSADDTADNTHVFKEEFLRASAGLCPDESVLCDILLDICYNKEYTKRFVWDICAGTIIHNLLIHNDNKINIPVMSLNGEFEYCGDRFTVAEVIINDEEEKE